MKYALTILCLACAFLTNRSVFGQISENTWTATIKVVGEDGSPIVGAECSVSYTLSSSVEGGDWGQIKGLTDTNGIISATHKDSSWGLGINLEKSGYYTTHIGHQLYRSDQFDEKTVAENRNSIITLVLKKVGKPVAMYAKRVGNGPPVFNEPVGYDLMIGDWVTPNGKGISKDIIFTGKLDRKAKNDFNYKLTVSFPKADDGIQEFALQEGERGSELRSTHQAPTNGFLTEVVKTMSHHPGQGAKDDMNDPNRNYYFRVRTVKDDNGNIVSAHYGKIYGDFMQFTYYLNPTPNDRNIEFDPKQNLLGGLQSFERVSAP